jgi:hypothetical protein
LGAACDDEDLAVKIARFVPVGVGAKPDDADEVCVGACSLIRFVLQGAFGSSLSDGAVASVATVILISSTMLILQG